MRYCLVCGTRISSGAVRCRQCYQLSFGAPRTKQAARGRSRRRAARSPRVAACENCGWAEDPARLQLHHPNIEGDPTRVVLLCQGPGTNNCHEAADRALGKWGEGAAAPAGQRVVGVAPLLPAHGSGPEIIHLVGPPCAGKSVWAADYAAENGYRHLEIGAFREYAACDGDAAGDLASALYQTDGPVIVEHSGVNSMILHAVYHAATTGDRPVRTVVITAAPETLRQRIYLRGVGPGGESSDRLWAWCQKILPQIARLYPEGVAEWHSTDDCVAGPLTPGPAGD